MCVSFHYSSFLWGGCSQLGRNILCEKISINTRWYYRIGRRQQKLLKDKELVGNVLWSGGCGQEEAERPPSLQRTVGTEQSEVKAEPAGAKCACRLGVWLEPKCGGPQMPGGLWLREVMAWCSCSLSPGKTLRQWCGARWGCLTGAIEVGGRGTDRKLIHVGMPVRTATEKELLWHTETWQQGHSQSWVTGIWFEWEEMALPPRFLVSEVGNTHHAFGLFLRMSVWEPCPPEYN